jgi:hypothetical protein
MSTLGQYAGLRPIKPGEVRNPKGINQYTYRDDARKHLEAWCKLHGKAAIEYIAGAAREGESWAAQLLWKELLPPVSKHDIQADVSGSVEITREDEWDALSGALDSLQPEAPAIPANANGNGTARDPE